MEKGELYMKYESFKGTIINVIKSHPEHEILILLN